MRDRKQVGENQLEPCGFASVLPFEGAGCHRAWGHFTELEEGTYGT